jgi:hypothetical protein
MQLFALLAPASMLIGVLVVRPRLIAQRLRALLAPMAFLAVGVGTWVIVCTGEVGQVNWIANGPLESRLTAEIRGPVIGLSYDFVVLVVLVLAVAKVAAVWDRDVRDALVGQISQDRDFLALTVGWAVLPTIILSLASFAHPIYANRYVTASAPGFALLVAFLCVRAFPGILNRARTSRQKANKIRVGRTATIFGAIATVVLVLASLSSASSLQEDLQSTARYAAHHEQRGDVIALPDHAISAAIDYYLARGTPSIPHWPQIGVRQRYVEGLDLSLHPAFAGGLPQRVWLVTDYSASGINRFQRVLLQDGYVITDYEQFTGVTLLLYTLTPQFRITTPRKVVHKLRVVELAQPKNGAAVHGTYLLDAPAPVGVTKVEFEVTGGALKNAIIGPATSSLVGWYFLWDSRQVPNGRYTLRAIAYNAAGKSSRSRAATIRVAN